MSRFMLRPAGPADAYDVALFGRGQRGDVFAVFRWTTPTAGPMPVPEARLAVLADHDGAVDSYGVELQVTNLATSPGEAAAKIEVTAANGRSIGFEPTPANLAPEGCPGVEGQLYWDGPDNMGRQAAHLGPPPFAYHVVLTLDGVRHEATATWPDHQIPDYEPSVTLTFEPPLPSLGH